MHHAIGFDVGTSGLKGVLVESSGVILARAARPYATARPQAGWSEQDPEDWWRALRDVAGELTTGRPPPDVIGLSGQMHAPVLLDADGGALGPSILWDDQRSAAECREIDRLTDGRITDWTGNPPRAAFTVSKLLWLRRHRPDIHRRIAAVLLPKDFVGFRLTGVRVTDASDASGTNLFDVGAGRWSEPALDASGLPAGWFPPVVGSASVAGRITAAAASATGLPAGIPVVAGASDQAAAAVGCGNVAPGALSINLGTSAVVSATLRASLTDPSGACHTFRHAVPDAWQMMGGVLSAGGAVQWYRERIANGSDAAGDVGEGYAGMLAGARAVAPGADGLIFLPYLTGERAPHNDPHARGGWFGLTARHDRRHLARALLEGVCFSLRQLVDRIIAAGAAADGVTVVGGGARGGVWPEILASVLGRPITPVAAPDASALGAAMLAVAGLTGASPAALAKGWVRHGPIIDPKPAAMARYDEMQAIFDSLYPATRDAMQRLSAIDDAAHDSAERS